ncbi:hypothetical protein BJY21_004192 [Kineosphaera limosa]|uniref:SGNH hydrolase-type esterase domain-containing protein n=1 Tax=Kineosphaera limosa NBRC 100340 TaxID=1184609 RepID=K6X8E7_9MICO|nr:GDSL-type esterase/lipase family protein [Kineosphaera limosa]NYE03008.1 hypothetical protein [Kineosphaera limosa]GAB95099.1 hypothetical protein KILIM_016_00390 [Kineosphaera limosa NBRC 100340]
MDSPARTPATTPTPASPSTPVVTAARLEPAVDSPARRPTNATQAQEAPGTDGTDGTDAATVISLWRRPAVGLGALAALLAVTIGGTALAAMRPVEAPEQNPGNPPAAVAAPSPGQAAPTSATGDSDGSNNGSNNGAVDPWVSPPLYDSGRIGHWQRMGHEHSPEQAEQRAGTSARGVSLLGDSSLTRARPDLVKALDGRPVAYDHWNGRPTHGTVDVVAALDGAKRLPNTLVLLSGSNDVFFPAGLAPQIERLMTIAGPDRTVVWVTPYVKRPRHADADEHNTRRLRDDLLAAAAKHPNLHVVDWAEHVLALPAAGQKRLMPDGAHPSPQGCRELAALISAKLA